MGFFEDLFRGKKGSVSVQSNLSQAQAPVENQLGSYFGGQIGVGVPKYDGPLSAPITEYETAGLSALNKYLESGPDALYGDLRAAMGTQLSGQPSTNINTQTTEDYISRAIADPLRAQYEEEILPTLRESFVGSGNLYGSARVEEERRAKRDVERDIASQGAGLRYADEQARRGLAESAAGRQLQASGMAPGVIQSYEEFPLRQAQAGTSIGATQRLLEQAALDRELQEFIRTSPQMNPAIAQALQLIGTNTTNTIVRPSQPSILSQIGSVMASTGGPTPQVAGSGMSGNPNSTGSVGGTGGSAGPSSFEKYLPYLLMAAGCMPLGTLIEMADGTHKHIELVQVGDLVRGGKVLETIHVPRSRNHKFWFHRRDDGKGVVASKDHPFEDDSTMPVRSIIVGGEFTYDILTESGVYYVNGIALRSTLEGVVHGSH